MRVAVLINANVADRSPEIGRSLTAAGVTAEVVVCEPARLTETARRLADGRYAAIVAAGGDGTVSAVAAGLAGTGTPLAVMPLGTLNHFARDLGMSKDLDECARAIARGETMPIDVGEVNGRVFINNASIGIYPEIVMERDAACKTGR